MSKLSEKEHKKRYKLFEQGLSDREMGEILGVHPNTIKEWRFRNNLRKRRIKNFTYESKDLSEITPKMYKFFRIVATYGYKFEDKDKFIGETLKLIRNNEL